MTRDLCREISHAEEVLRAVAGDELAGLAVYVLPDTADPRLVGSDCGAWTGQVLDWTLRPVLRRLGEWRGAGFATVLVVKSLEKFPIGPARERATTGYVLHEFAHFLLFSPRCQPAADLPPEADTPSLVQGLESLLRPYSAPAVARAAWWGHEHQFIRTAMHLAWSAREKCDPQLLPEELAIAGDMYGLSPCRRYEQALAGEFELRSRLPLRAILERPAPPAFLNLFCRDTAGGAAPT